MSGIPLWNAPLRLVGGTLTDNEIDRMFAKLAVIEGLSDIFLHTDEPMRIEVWGKYYRYTEGPLSHNVLTRIVTVLFNSPTATSELAAARPITPSYRVEIERHQHARFRVIALTGKTSSGGTGYCIVMRLIDSTPPTIERNRIPQSIADAFVAVKSGLVFVTGVTGSGKSSTLAALLNYDNHHGPGRHVVTCEDPVEYLHKAHRNFYTQVEVEKGVKSYADGLKASLRQAPKTIYVGEMRNEETITLGMTMALTGHAVVSTLHCGSVAETCKRIMLTYPSGARQAIQLDFAETAKLLMTQKLVRTVDGRRAPVIEWLSITPAIRSKMEDAKNIGRVMAEMVGKHGVSLIESAAQLLNDGVISKETFAEIQAGYQYDMERVTRDEH